MKDLDPEISKDHDKCIERTFNTWYNEEHQLYKERQNEFFNTINKSGNMTMCKIPEAE